MNFLIALGLSLSTVPIPFLGLKVFFPIALLLALLVNKKIFQINLLVAFLVIMYMLTIIVLHNSEIDKNLIIMNLLLSTSLIFLNFKTNSKDWIKVSFFHIIIFAISYISIYIFNFDFISSAIYGESKHSVGAFQDISFRSSGIYQEPSTFAYHLLSFALIIHIFNPNEYLKYKVTILIFSMLSFSVASITSAIALLYIILKSTSSKVDKIKIILFLMPIIMYILYILIDFLLYKIDVYTNIGFDDTARFQALYVFLSDFHIDGIPSELLKYYVLYDIGPLFSAVLIFGIFSLPFIALYIYSIIKKPIIITLLFTKIALTNPILWFIIRESISKKRNNK